MPTHGAGAIGSLEYPTEERKVLAKKSLAWKCSGCGVTMRDALPPLTEASKAATAGAKELAQQISFKDERERKDTSVSSDAGEANEGAVNTPTERVTSSPESPTTLPPATGQSPIANIPAAARPNLGGNIDYQADMVFNQRPARNTETGSSAQLVMIVIIAIMIAALLFRRIWIMNDGQFSSRSDL